MNLTQHFPVLIIAVLLISAFVLPLLFRWNRRLSEPALLLALSLALAMTVFLLVNLYREGTSVYHLGGWPPPWGIELRVDFLRVYMLLVLLSLALWIFVYALRDLEHELKKEVLGWYYALYALLIGAMSGMALTNDLFNLFVFMEIAAIASCAAVRRAGLRARREVPRRAVQPARARPRACSRRPLQHGRDGARRARAAARRRNRALPLRGSLHRRRHRPAARARRR